MTAECSTTAATSAAISTSMATAVPYRTYPGTHPTKARYFTRGTSRDRYAALFRGRARLCRQHAAAECASSRPRPGHGAAAVQANAAITPQYGVIYFGSTAPAMDEAIELLEASGHQLDRLRIRAFPFHSSVASFIADHDFVYVVEQNRDAQLRSLIVNRERHRSSPLVPILHYDGTPITARFIAGRHRRPPGPAQADPLRKVKS